jgi:glucokinase
MAVLAGDIGGTHTRLALADGDEGEIRIQRLGVYSSQEYDALGEVVKAFLNEEPTSFDNACFGVAGPVRSGRARATNLPWVVDDGDLSRSLNARVSVINDLEAGAWSIPVLQEDQVALLKEGNADPRGHGAVIAPGTGLGEAGLFFDGTDLLPFASEGGHTEFAPANDVERGIQVELASRFGHVSWERVVSGPGLIALHQYLRTRHPSRAFPECPLEPPTTSDAGPPDISDSARNGGCPVCVETMDRFCRLLGVKAGNLALTLLATRGVWIGGGIAANILDFLRNGGFREGFTAKGRMKPLLDRIPVHVILEEHAPLLGAARCALLRAAS